MARINEGDARPLIAPQGSEQLTSGNTTAHICHKLIVCFSVGGNLTIQTLDGTAVTISSMPVGCFDFDIQFDKVTWTGTATAAGFYYA